MIKIKASESCPSWFVTFLVDQPGHHQTTGSNRRDMSTFVQLDIRQEENETVTWTIEGV